MAVLGDTFDLDGAQRRISRGVREGIVGLLLPTPNHALEQISPNGRNVRGSRPSTCGWREELPAKK